MSPPQLTDAGYDAQFSVAGVGSNRTRRMAPPMANSWSYASVEFRAVATEPRHVAYVAFRMPAWGSVPALENVSPSSDLVTVPTTRYTLRSPSRAPSSSACADHAPDGMLRRRSMKAFSPESRIRFMTPLTTAVP